MKEARGGTTSSQARVDRRARGEGRSRSANHGEAAGDDGITVGVAFGGVEDGGRHEVAAEADVLTLTHAVRVFA